MNFANNLLLIWPAFLMLAFAGWGNFLYRVLKFTSQEAPLPLRAIWGIATTLAFSGFVLLFYKHDLTRIWIIWICVGSGWWILDCIPKYKIAYFVNTEKNRTNKLLNSVLWVSIFYVYLWSLLDMSYAAWDDFVAYFPMARRLLQTGDFSDPFSWRRMGSFGGQTVLHSFYLLLAPEWTLNVLERGICRILGAWYISQPNSATARWNKVTKVIALLLLVGDMPSVNIAPLYSGICLFLGIWGILRTLDSTTSISIGEKNRLAVLHGILIAATATLRPTYFSSLAIIYFLLTMHYGLDLIRNGNTVRNNPLAFLLKSIGVSTLLLLPWSFLLYQSSGTPLFPLFKGTFNSSYGTFHSITPSMSEIKITLATLASPELLILFLFLMLTLFISQLRVVYLIIIMVTAVIVPCLISASMPASENPIHGIRYSYPLIILAFVSLSLRCLEIWDSSILNYVSKALKRLIAFAICGWIAMFIIPPLLIDFRVFIATHGVERISKLFSGDPVSRIFAPGAQEVHQKLQMAIPENCKIIVALDYPFLLNFRRNYILNIDVPGQVSPPPGIPLEANPQAIDRYLKSQGIEYILFIDPDSSQIEFGRNLWERVARTKKSFAYFVDWSKWHLLFINYLDWKKTHGNKYSNGGYYASKIE